MKKEGRVKVVERFMGIFISLVNCVMIMGSFYVRVISRKYAFGSYFCILKAGWPIVISLFTLSLTAFYHIMNRGSASKRLYNDKSIDWIIILTNMLLFYAFVSCLL